MEDSHFSHSECQMISKSEAENLICKVHEKHLVNGSRMVKESNPTSNDKAATDISGTANLFLMEPLKIIGGTKSGLSAKSTAIDF